MAALVLEELATLGVREFINIGIAGALPSDLNFGDLVLCTSPFATKASRITTCLPRGTRTRRRR